MLVNVWGWTETADGVSRVDRGGEPERGGGRPRRKDSRGDSVFPHGTTRFPTTAPRGASRHDNLLRTKLPPHVRPNVFPRIASCRNGGESEPGRKRFPRPPRCDILSTMKRHALFVGVDQYADGQIPNLSCAVNDAVSLHGFFRFGAGYDRVELLQNPAGKKEVLDSVRRLTAGLGPGDLFLFFFAGHGFCVGEDHMLVCAKDLYEDVKHEDDGLPLGQLKRRMSGGFDRAILLDACQSDILATRGGEPIAERDLSLIHDCGPRFEGEGALAIVTSCDAGQTAGELAAHHHGLFTMAMLDLLESSSRARRRIDLSDAFRLELGRKMAEIAAVEGISADQRPRFSSTGAANLVILDGGTSSAKDVPSGRDVPPTPRPSVVRNGRVFSDGERKLVAGLCELLAPEWKRSHAGVVASLREAESADRAVDALDDIADVVLAEFAGANCVTGLLSPGGLRHRPRSYQDFAPTVLVFDSRVRALEEEALRLSRTFGSTRVCDALRRVLMVAKLFGR